MNKNTLTLDSVQAAFSHWREQRLKRNEPIPEVLRQQALALCEHYPITQIINALGLNHSHLKAWQQQAEDYPEFVALTAPALPSAPDTLLTVTLRNLQGVQLEMSGLNTQQLCALVTTFSQGAECAL